MKENSKIVNIYIEYINNYFNYYYPYKGGRWCYEDGIILNASWNFYKATNNKKYRDFVINFYEKMITDEGEILEYNLNEFNIDNIAGGIVLIETYKETKKEKFLKAIKILHHQLELHPRTKEGSFFHKQIYPNQVWMDGIYMGLVFYAKYASYFKDIKAVEDIKLQLNNLDKRLYDEKRDLFVHAYDESKLMQWANSKDGKSPNVWSRACGWVAMALVDIYEELKLDECIKIYKKLTNGLLKHLDKGMLYQVVDKETYPGNYLETSGSAMLSYSMFKATRLNIVDLKDEGNRIFKEIINNYFNEGLDGKYHLGGICKVAGLDNTRRNGSYEYYLSEEIATDEVKGVAPFILIYSELIKKAIIEMNPFGGKYGSK